MCFIVCDVAETNRNCEFIRICVGCNVFFLGKLSVATLVNTIMIAKQMDRAMRVKGLYVLLLLKLIRKVKALVQHSFAQLVNPLADTNTITS